VERYDAFSRGSASPVPETMECPKCQQPMDHTWRADMSRLRLLDEFRCLLCGEHRLVVTEPQRVR
jgi:hypothetical protein